MRTNEKLERQVIRMNGEDIQNRFTYHRPKEGQQDGYEALRGEAKVLAFLINEKVPESREKTIAMAKLEECVMWANAGIARNE